MKKLFILFLFLFASLAQAQLPDTTGGRYSEVVIARKSWGDIVKGDVLGIYQPEDNASRLLANYTNKDSVPRNAFGYVKKSSVAYAVGLKLRKIRMERFAVDSVRRVNQFTSVVDTITNTANDDGEYMHVPLYVKRRLRRTKHMMFGQVGSEIWFGGNIKITRTTMLALIDTIATHRSISVSALRRKAQKRITGWPIHMKKKFVILRCYDLSDSLKSVYGATDSLGAYLYTVPLANVATETGFTTQQITNAIQNDSDLRSKGVINIENLVELK